MIIDRVFKHKSRTKEIDEDIEFIRYQIEMNDISIKNLDKYRANSSILKEQNRRYSRILKVLEKERGLKNG